MLLVLAADDEDVFSEAKRRGTATYETEDILEEAAKVIGPKRAKEILLGTQCPPKLFRIKLLDL